MNTKQHRSPGRLSELHPFQFEVEEHDEETRERGVPDELLETSLTSEGDPAYGCVEWYAYSRRPSPKRQQRPN